MGKIFVDSTKTPKTTLDHLRNPQNFLNRLENEKSFDSLRELEGFKEICRILVEMVKKGT